MIFFEQRIENKKQQKEYNTNRIMKRTFIFTLIATFFITVNAQTFSAPQAKAFVKKGTWRNGFTAAKPHKSTDWTEFATQYQKNQATWDSVFNWLATTNLDSLPAGKYPICGITYARIQEANTRPDEQCRIESHRKYIDFQWTVRGTERLGKYDHEQVWPATPYNAKQDFRRYEVKDGEKPKYFKSNSKTFFIFFPNDYHQAMLQVGGKKAALRKVIVKIEYKT
jgi:YhcH/YjgK/YiaL family protein